MERLIPKVSRLRNRTYDTDVLGYAKLLSSDFTEHYGCIIFKECTFKRKVMNQFVDKTNIEASSNHIHMSDFINDHKGIVLLKLGMLTGNLLALKLKSNYPMYRFRIIIAYDVKNEFGYNDCTVRFHRIRKGESWLSKNLEEYKTDAVGYFDI